MNMNNPFGNINKMEPSNLFNSSGSRAFGQARFNAVSNPSGNPQHSSHFVQHNFPQSTLSANEDSSFTSPSFQHYVTKELTHSIITQEHQNLEKNMIYFPQNNPNMSQFQPLEEVMGSQGQEVNRMSESTFRSTIHMGSPAIKNNYTGNIPAKSNQIGAVGSGDDLCPSIGSISESDHRLNAPFMGGGRSQSDLKPVGAHAMDIPTNYRHREMTSISNQDGGYCNFNRDHSNIPSAFTAASRFPIPPFNDSQEINMGHPKAHADLSLRTGQVPNITPLFSATGPTTVAPPPFTGQEQGFTTNPLPSFQRTGQSFGLASSYRGQAAYSFSPASNRGAITRHDTGTSLNSHFKMIHEKKLRSSRGSFEYGEQICSSDTGSMIEWLKMWETDVRSEKKGKHNGQLRNLQQLLLRWSELLLELEGIRLSLLDSDCSLEKESFYRRCAENSKAEISQINQKVCQMKRGTSLSDIVMQRRKKRKSQRAGKRKKQEDGKKLLADWEMKSKKIDAWREKLIQEEKENFEKEELRKDVDNVLREVRTKISEAKGMQQYLENLVILRAARVKKGENHGYITTPEADDKFTKVIGDLSTVTENQLKHYQKEETMLRSLIEASHNRKNKSDAKVSDCLEHISTDDFPKELCEESSITLEGQDEEVRKDWDKYLTTSEKAGFSIPDSWIDPPSNPSQEWSRFRLDT